MSPGTSDDFGQDLVYLQYILNIDELNSFSATTYFGSIGGWFEYSDFDILGLQSRHYGLISNYKHQSKNKNFVWVSGLQANVFGRENWYAANPQNETRIYNNWGRKDEGSLFSKVNYRIEKLTLFADLQVRYAGFTYIGNVSDDYTVDPINWTFFNPKAGITYDITKTVSAFGSVGIVTREPTRSDLLNGADNITAANKDTTGAFKQLKPENLTDFEFGLNLNFPWLKGQINGFFMDFRNEIAATGAYTSWFVPLRKNVASSTRSGVEWSFNVKPHRWFSIQTTGAYTIAKIAAFTTDFDKTTYKDVTPLLTPSWILSNGVTFSPVRWLDFNLTSRYVSKSYLANNDNDELSLPAYLIYDTRIAVNYNHRYALALMVNNLTNQRYFNNGSVFADASGALKPAYIVQAPLNFYLTFTATIQ
jgi:iron complex outermembrane receptor protein